MNQPYSVKVYFKLKVKYIEKKQSYSMYMHHNYILYHQNPAMLTCLYYTVYTINSQNFLHYRLTFISKISIQFLYSSIKFRKHPTDSFKFCLSKLLQFFMFSFQTLQFCFCRRQFLFDIIIIMLLQI